MLMPRAFLIALQFLTTLPVRLSEQPTAHTCGRSLLYYPLVGLIIGLLLCVIGWLLHGSSPYIVAAIMLSVWVLITGGLHLDGLADSADAWIGGLGDRQRTLDIMKDPYCGPIAVVTLILVLLLKFTALTQLASNQHWIALLLAPVLGRTILLVLFLTTPYVRAEGLGHLLSLHMPRGQTQYVVLATLVAIFLFWGLQALWLMVAIGLGFVVLRGLMMRRLGGATGDTAGALTEITETIALLISALIG